MCEQCPPIPCCVSWCRDVATLAVLQLSTYRTLPYCATHADASVGASQN